MALTPADARQPAWRFLLAGALLLASLAAHAVPVVSLTDAEPHLRVGKSLRYFNDPGQACDLACARIRFARNDRVEQSRVEAPNFGFTDSWWFHLRVRNDSARTTWIASTGVAFVDDVRIHVEYADGTTSGSRTGDLLPTRERPVFSRTLAAPVTLEPGSTADVYLRLTNSGPITISPSFMAESHFAHESEIDHLLHGLYFGILLAITLYNLLIWLNLRDRTHLLYAVYLTVFGVSMLNVQGFSSLYFWSEYPWLTNRAMPLSAVASGIAVNAFTRNFLRLPRTDPRDLVMRSLYVVYAALFLLALLAPFGFAVQVIYAFSFASVLWLLWLGLDQLARGNRTAYYFVMAWTALLVMLGAHILTRFGLLPSNVVTENGLLFGSAAEAILLSTALAHRFALIRAQNEELQKQAAEELEQRVAERTGELDKALRTRSEFLATVSHEIRTPMNGVLGIAELLEDTPLNDRQREYVRIIQGSGHTLLAIINDVLDLSRIEAARTALQYSRFDLHEVVNASTRIFLAEVDRKHLDFRVDIDARVPDMITGDPVRLQQILVNLLSNAVKFTEAGSITLRVERANGHALRFTVRDTGIGIAVEHQARIFEAFTRGDPSTNRRYGGTGLGLAISRRLIELMGGEITLQSRPGEGTTLSFTLPLPHETVQRPDDGREPAPRPIGARRLMVVDDNLVNLQVAAGMLKKLGHDVDAHDNAGEAIDCLFAESARYDAVFMDCEMPDLDGLTATRRIREREKAEGRRPVPIIALTAHAFREQVEACLAAGMDDHLSKPLGMKQLEDVLQRTLS